MKKLKANDIAVFCVKRKRPFIKLIGYMIDDGSNIQSYFSPIYHNINDVYMIDVIKGMSKKDIDAAQIQWHLDERENQYIVESFEPYPLKIVRSVSLFFDDNPFTAFTEQFVPLVFERKMAFYKKALNLS